MESAMDARVDPRILRTRAHLREALFDLARERPLDQVTVGDIADRAGVNRTTFYQHYSDKNSLLVDALSVAVEGVVAKIDADTGPQDGHAILRAYLEHIDTNAALYQRILGGLGSAGIQAWLRERLADALLANIEDHDGLVDLPLDVLGAAISGAGLSIIRAWLDQSDRVGVDEAASWIWTVLEAHGAIQDRSPIRTSVRPNSR